MDIARQREIAQFIDLAVQCWREVADEHDIAQSGRFRDCLASRLIDSGLFVGYAVLKQAEAGQ